jgi:hypothetical protein
MPTLVMFANGERFVVNENLDQVNQQLNREKGLFTMGDAKTRVVVFAANINYLQEMEGSAEP